MSRLGTRLRTSARKVLRRVRGRLRRAIYEPPGFLDTQEEVMLADLGLAHPDRIDYSPTAWRWARRALRSQGIKAHDVFVDFGSGKGRVVYVAAQYPFARVIGVEISEQLNEVARRNIAANRDRLLCRNVDLITCDAADFDVPDDMTYAYFYNPFTGETFRRVIDNIVESIGRNPRQVRLIYPNPKMAPYLLERGFELVETIPGGHSDDGGRGEISVYANRP